MERIYSFGTSDKDPKFFIGLEVEHTRFYNMKTLFCRGDVSVDEIINILKKYSNIPHVYLNSNHTTLDNQENKIETLLSLGYMLTIEVPYTPEITLDSNPNITWLISIPFANANQSNISLKIDDLDFSKCNPGVWTLSLNEEMKEFTPWEKYSLDEVIT